MNIHFKNIFCGKYICESIIHRQLQTMDVKETIFLNSKKYKDLAEKRSVIFNEIEKALELVKKFIIQKKRLIYGGMCIDLNLKVIGHPGIYPNDSLPDFDFMSPDFYQDSIELADILYKSNLPNVSAINAIHLTSRKVRVNFSPVADISYIPSNIYEKIPYITITKSKNKELNKYLGMRIVHPDFQRLDLHRSFNIPFANPPQEVILHRLEKDQKRFRLFDQDFSFTLTPSKLTSGETIISKKYLENNMIGGVVGYALLHKFLGDLIATKVISKIIKDNGVDVYIQEKLSRVISFDLKFGPENLVISSEIPVNIITSDHEQLINQIKGDFPSAEIKYYNKYLDNLRPETIRVVNAKMTYEIFLNEESTPCYDLQKVMNLIEKLTLEKIKENTSAKIYIAQPNGLMLYFLQKSFEDVEFKNYWINLYQSTIYLVEAAEKVVLAIEEQEPELLPKIYQNLPFFLPTQTYPSSNNFTNNHTQDHLS